MRQARFGCIIQWQHCTIASASLSRLFAPLPQFRKWEIHTVFLHFRNFELEQKSCLRLLAELCGAAIEYNVQVNCYGAKATLSVSPAVAINLFGRCSRALQCLSSDLEDFSSRFICLTAYATTSLCGSALDYRSASGGCASGSFPAATVSPAQSASSH